MMPSSPYARALVLGISLVSAAAATAAGCSSGDGTGTTSGGGSGASGGAGGDATTSSTTSSSSSTTSSSSSSSSGTMYADCPSCLQGECKTELAACDSECVAIQACLDSVCSHLSMVGASDEGQCQVQCQQLHLGAKQAHLAVVNCVQGATQCMPPCAAYSYDWDQCVAKETSGTCKAQLDACNADSNCQTYQGCASSCMSNAACQACSSTPEGKSGRALYEAYWQCVETTCLPEGWLPNF